MNNNKNAESLQIVADSFGSAGSGFVAGTSWLLESFLISYWKIIQTCKSVFVLIKNT